MLFRKSFLLIFIFLSPVGVFADNSRFILTKDYTTFSRHLSQIIGIGKFIELNPESPIVIRLDAQRQALLDNSVRLYKSFQLGSRATPTLDISSKFQFAIQKYRLSCEIAATRMVIESLSSIKISEDTIFSSLRMMPEPLSSDNIWGDPDVGFVGSLTGSQYMKTGYGIYEKPLQKYLNSIGFVAESSNRMDGKNLIPRKRLISLFDAIESGKRVILWGDWCTTPVNEDGIVKKVDTYIVNNLPISAINPCDRSQEQRTFSWKTPSGKTVEGLSGEHAFLLLGYLGKKESPTHIVVWDTSTGKHIYPYSEWMRKWGAMQYRSLTVAMK